MASERIRLPPLREALGYNESSASDPFATRPPLSSSTPRGLRSVRSHAQLPSPTSSSGFPGLSTPLTSSQNSSAFPLSSTSSRRLASSVSSRQLRHPGVPGAGGGLGGVGSGFVPSLAPISNHSVPRRTSSENLRKLQDRQLHQPSHVRVPLAPASLRYRDPPDVDPFGSPLQSLGPSTPTYSSYGSSYTSSTPSPPFSTSRHLPSTSPYSSHAFPDEPSTPMARTPRRFDPPSTTTPQLSSLHLASPYSSNFDAKHSSDPRDYPPLNSLRSSHGSPGILSSESDGTDGREPYVLPLHPYGSDGFLDDALSHGPAPPRHAFRRRRSESSLSPPPLSSGSSGGFGSSSSGHSSPYPDPHADPFDPLPNHNFPAQGASAPLRTEPGHMLRSQRSVIVPSRTRRYMPPPNSLESLIGNSGMLQSIDGAGSSINIPGLGGMPGGSHLNRYTCELCGKGFTRPSALAIHMNSHTGTRPYTCQYCGKDFSVASNLRRHLKIHEGLDDMLGQSDE